MVGGLLVALSAVGIFAGYLGATGDDRRPYVVATSDLAVGHRITAADLAVVRIDLPPALHRLAHDRPGPLVGAVVLGPVGRGELLQNSDVLVGEGTAGDGREISFPIDAARAVDGSLRTGEQIDVLATYGTGTDAYTVVIARGARIANRSDPAGRLPGSGEQVVTLSVPDAATTLAVAHAVNAGVLTLVRTAAPPGDGVEVAGYRPPGADPASAPSVPAVLPAPVSPPSAPLASGLPQNNAGPPPGGPVPSGP